MAATLDSTGLVLSGAVSVLASYDLNHHIWGKVHDVTSEEEARAKGT
jgi:hypothetical protein